MNWNIAAEATSLVILGIIWTYSRKGSNLPSLKNRVFQGCLIVTFGAIFTNILSTIMIYNYCAIPIWMTWTVTMIYFILTPLMGMAYFFYTVSVIYTENAQIKRTISLGMIPGIIYILFVLINPFTGILFSISPDCGYERGNGVFLTYLVFYIYCIICIFITIANSRKIDREIYKILAAFPILALGVIVVQQIFPDIILSGSAAASALLIIYLHLQNKQISMDYLTNVPNHKELMNMVGLMLKKAPKQEFVLIAVSLRDFRQINNTFGQHNGDELLKEVCRFLCGIAPRGSVYRFSGDEFALLFSHIDERNIKACIDAVNERMREPWFVGDYRVVLSAVIGVVYHNNEFETIEKIVNAIEYAVFQAKTGKYGKVCFCDKAMLAKLERRRKIIQILKEKISDKSFEMYYQPIYSVETEDFKFAESLMRIPDSPLGPIYPSEFIPIAEETGLIIDITYIVLDKVCEFINSLNLSGISIGSVHVNFSAVQFSQSDLSERVMEIINKNNIPPSAVKIEFTESTLAESTQTVTDFVLKMQKYGIKMGLDDFGTGYSNIATVINVPFATIKLDKSLVWASVRNKKSALAVKNMTRTFKELGMKVIAEGVENEEERDLMAEFGVDQIQGFLYAKPMPEDKMRDFLIQHGTPDGINRNEAGRLNINI
ncbi:bifunctional diguanylate cyclase/phosphodiesterase [Lachnospiraceae bacterium NSJ-143]|nr:bifunctional diguanylate cyclase/phosphodiesterase [Lachnospiraceae bacterium NSJ-143]